MPPNKNKRVNEDSPERRSKRRRVNEDEEEEDREKEPVSSKAASKKASGYGGAGGGGHKPAELFRKDLISAMKLPDSEPLTPEDYLLIADTWRQEWERGVQVPVNDVALRSVDKKEVAEKSANSGDFKIPKKFLHSVKDETYQLGLHELTGMSQLAEQVVRYDLDDLDATWLRQLNEQREEVGNVEIHEWTMERVIEALESQCHDNMAIKKKTEEGLGIEYDEDIVCEICQSPDSEDTNEMVFCDGCDICVHQACYGIQTVPEGSWLCRSCALGIKPACILCPKVGGAMKSTRSGTKWAHVSCAIWIPEVTIGCVEKMEPVTKISQIPASRWALICCICKERNGACIQCSVKACKTAFHVTCAITDKLEMKTVLVEEKNTEDVKLKAYCPKHSRNRERHGSESDPDSPRKSVGGTPVKESRMSEEEMATLRAERLQKLEEEFYNLVTVADVATKLELANEVVEHIYVFWKLKRRSMFNRPLLTPKTEEADLLEKQQEDSLVARMKMFVHLRQDLERVRNLSYMISRREKMKRQFNASRESVFYAALEVLTDKNLNLSTREVEKIVKSYKDLPPPYGNMGKKSRTVTPCVSRAGSVSSRTSSIEKDLVSNKRKSTEIQPDGIATISSERKKVDERRKSESAKGLPEGAKVSETPKSRKSRQKSKQVSGDTKAESEEMKDENEGEMTMDTSETGMADETLVNTSQASSVNDDDKTIVQSNSESESVIKNKSSVKSENIQKGKNTARRSVGRPRKIKQESDGQVEDESDKSEIKKPAAKKTRTRSSLPEIIDVVGGENDDEVKSEHGEESMEADVKPAVKDTRSKSTSDKRERRYSAAVKLTDKEKEELLEKFPSAKNVSDHIKTELTGYLRNNKLLVSNKLRQKVQTALLNGKRRNRFGNGIIIDHSQRKIDSYYMKSPPPCDIGPLKSPAKNVSRVLNELSPTRDRFEANNIERTTILRSGLKVSDCHLSHRSGNTPNRQSPSLSEKSYDGHSVLSPGSRRNHRGDSPGVASVRERLFEEDSLSRRKTRSRESSPVSSTCSVKSFSSITRTRQESPRMRTRSITPSSVGKDSDESESENICGSETKRSRR